MSIKLILFIFAAWMAAPAAWALDCGDIFRSRIRLQPDVLQRAGPMAPLFAAGLDRPIVRTPRLIMRFGALKDAPWLIEIGQDEHMREYFFDERNDDPVALGCELLEIFSSGIRYAGDPSYVSVRRDAYFVMQSASADEVIGLGMIARHEKEPTWSIGFAFKSSHREDGLETEAVLGMIAAIRKVAPEATIRAVTRADEPGRDVLTDLGFRHARTGAHDGKTYFVYELAPPAPIGLP